MVYMCFERRLSMACLCMLALLLLFSMACDAATVRVHLNSGGMPLASGVPAVFVNGSRADYAGDGTYQASLDTGDNPSVDVMASYNGYCVSGSTPIISGMANSSLELAPGQVEHRVCGTIYSITDGARNPWSGDGQMGVFVNGAPATVDGPTYAAVLRAPADGEPINIAVIDKGGYTLGESSGHVDLSRSSDGVNVEVPSLEVSGDVYSGGAPADGASVVIYVNDRPVGPIMAHAGPWPMFSTAINGGHPGDRITVTASKDDHRGIAIQDTPGYNVFLTVNLQKTGPWIRDTISRLYYP
jgi:hypothetical protein